MTLKRCVSAVGWRLVLAVALLATGVSAPVRAQDNASKPLTRQRVLEAVDLLKGDAADGLIPQIQQRGVDFQISQADERELRAAGASEKLLSAIRDAYRAPPLPPLTAGPPLAKDELILLLGNGAPASRLEDLVAVRGVSFTVTSGILDELTAAGAGTRLINLIKLRGAANGTQPGSTPVAPVQQMPAPVQPQEPPVQPQPPPVQQQSPVQTRPVDPFGMQTRVPTAPAASPGRYVISIVETNRKWRLGLRSEPYNKISEYIRTLLIKSLADRGFTQVESLEGPCCKVVIELLEVTGHDAVIKKPGVDVAATISVLGTDGVQIYSKGYRGESRTMMNSWGHMINHASENLVANAGQDQELITAMSSTGRN